MRAKPARRPRRSRCPSRSPRAAVRRGGAAATSAGAGRSGSGRAASPCCTCSPATTGAPCRRGCARAVRPSSWTSMPQLHSHRMHAVGCQSVVAIVSAVLSQFGLEQRAQLRADGVQRRRRPSARGSRSARPRSDVIASSASSRARCAARPRARSSRRARPPSARTSRPRAPGARRRPRAPRSPPRRSGSPREVRAQQALAVGGDEGIEGGDRVARPPDVEPLRDVVRRVLRRLAEQLVAATREVVVDRSARRAAVGEHVVDARRPRAALAHEHRGRHDHPLTSRGCHGRHYVIAHNRGDGAVT